MRVEYDGAILYLVLTLDALRGVAALAVIVLHSNNGWLPGAGLAVDLFFMLSGFVIAYSYEDRLLDGMTAWEFFKRRFVRLYPMVLAGSVAGVLHVSFRIITHPELHQFTGVIARLFVFSITMIPNIFTPGMAQMVHPVHLGDIFPINTVLWSLFFEVIVNIIYGLWPRKLDNSVLLAIVSISFVWLVSFGHFGGYMQDNFGEGFPRAGFGFFAGILLYRLFLHGKLPDVSLSGTTLACMLLAVFLMPDATALNHLARCASVAVVFPLIVLFGANHKPAGLEAKISAFLGAISYPIYLLHRPIYDFILAGSVKVEPAGENSKVLAAVLAVTIFLSVIVSYIVLRLYDEPARRFLGRVLIKKRH